MTSDESIVGTAGFAADRDGQAAMRPYVAAWPDQVWAVEGFHGIGRYVANWLLAEGEKVVDARPSCPRGSGCSRPGRAARPTPPMRTPLRWSARE